MRRVVRFRVVALVAFVFAGAVSAMAQAPIVYKVTVPEPEHRWLQVEATFPDIGRAPLHLQMSRSSPGRYALHEFAKNLFEIKAYDGKGLELALLRLTPSEWSASGHDSTVRVVYRLYGDRIDGTYLAVDTTHEHMNMPATFMWARGFEDRPIRVEFAPANPAWKVATQLFPTADPLVFTAPNLQYFMDSPTEVGPLSFRTFTLANPDGKRFEFRVALHHDGTDADVDDYAANVEKIVREEQAVYGEFPDYDTGTYTVIADYLPYSNGDGMEHRNSAIVTSRLSIANPQQRMRVLGTVAHEFFHCWIVERIRPAGLEPFDFTRINMSDSLWLAEGFTQYYGNLILARAGLVDVNRAASDLSGEVNGVLNGSGRLFRSAAEMSRLAPFVDAARSVDRTDFETTFISYYTWGLAIALGLDLSLREMSGGKLSLDDYMQALWRVHGKPGGPAPGVVAKPFTLRDARDRLAEVSGNRTFANEFFDRYIEGRDAPDYATLVEPAGLVVRRRNAGAAWMGQFGTEAAGPGVGITTLVPPGMPAYAAGLEQDDVIRSLDGDAVSSPGRLQEILKRHKPGDEIKVEFVRRSGPVTATIALVEDPSIEIVTLESTGATPTDAQKAFRTAWLGTHQKTLAIAKGKALASETIFPWASWATCQQSSMTMY